MLTPEQQEALDQLFPPAKNGNGNGSAVPVPSALADLLQAWLGISGEQVQRYLEMLLRQRLDWEGRFLDWAEGNPMESAFGFLGAAAAAFYAAERVENPKIKTYIDAFYYIATCASVGYADVFAVTQRGKAIAALVMVVGPGLADRALNRPVSR
ncbi:MAG TPA: ion channel [Chloroflexota bacterium]|nr:ion channel [Chloroflexota bacterium]HUM71005.1 ion channel [Chloroflexota bacterium]